LPPLLQKKPDREELNEPVPEQSDHAGRGDHAELEPLVAANEASPMTAVMQPLPECRWWRSGGGCFFQEEAARRIGSPKNMCGEDFQLIFTISSYISYKPF